jgi:hypothetical protein
MQKPDRKGGRNTQPDAYALTNVRASAIEHVEHWMSSLSRGSREGQSAQV